jgi:Cd2+/Zn2+-exporting ATPase
MMSSGGEQESADLERKGSRKSSFRKFRSQSSAVKSSQHNSSQPESLSVTSLPVKFLPVKSLVAETLELAFAIGAGCCLLTGWSLSLFSAAGEGWSIGFYAVAYFLGGFYASLDALRDLRVPRFRIDFLMIVAALGAAYLGRWGEGALLLFLFSLGHALEHLAMGRARRAIEALGELTPHTATVKRNGITAEIPVQQLRLNDIVVVRPNDRITADGVVIAGSSSVNQAPITGESIPVDKWGIEDSSLLAADPVNLTQIPAPHQVFAGTINETGLLEIQVTCLAEDTTLARVVRLVNEASSQKSPSQHFADNFERYFVPVVLLFVLSLLFVFVFSEEPFSDSFYRAMAVLIGASPCALAISTPSAVLSGIARGAQQGVLIKGGNPLENLGQLQSIAFDKTGTLTRGEPRVTDVICWDGATESELLQTAVAVERMSDHPLAAAVVRDGVQRLLNGMPDRKEPDNPDSWFSGDRNGLNDNPILSAIPVPSQIRSITGKGVTAVIGNAHVTIGNDRLFLENGNQLPEGFKQVVQQLRENGRTTMVVQRNDHFLGVIGLMDTPRSEATATIQQLMALGIRKMMIVSGDSQQVVDAVAREVGIEEGRGDLMPAEKVELIRQLAGSGPVAMVGDGVNDAPALAGATVGIAMGAAGSAVALESADVALMSDDLTRLSFAIGLGRKTSRIIRQNIWISLGTVAVLVPSCLWGLPIGWAVVFHEGSTVAVVVNALRLLGYRQRTNAGNRR